MGVLPVSPSVCASQVFCVDTFMGVWDAPTVKPSRFWTNHRAWLVACAQSLTPEKRKTVNETKPEIVKRKRNASDNKDTIQGVKHALRSTQLLVCMCAEFFCFVISQPLYTPGHVIDVCWASC